MRQQRFSTILLWYTHRSVGQSVRAFTLLEMMVSVGIVAIIAAVAIPAFQKYVNDAREAEQTHIALEAFRSQQALRGTYGEYAEALQLAGCEKRVGTANDIGCLQIDVRVPNKKFNLVTGTFDAKMPGAAYSFWDLGYSVEPSPNSYGFKALPGNTFDKEKFVMGVEGNLDADDHLNIIAINERGILFKLCDDFSDSGDPVMNGVYKTYSSNSSIKCTVASGGGGGAED